MTEQEKKDLLDEMRKDKKGPVSQFWNIPSNEEGKRTIRILPPLAKFSEKVFYKKYKIHWVDGTSYICLNQTLTDKNGKVHEAEPCPICEMSKKIYKNSEKDSPERKLSNSLFAQERYISRIIVRGDEKETAPKFWQYGVTIYEMLYNLLTDSDYGMIIDPKEGRDYILSKRGTGRNSKYDTSSCSANISPIFKETEKLKDCLEKAKEMDYNSLFEFTSPKIMEKAAKASVFGEKEDEVEIVDNEEKVIEPVKKAHKTEVKVEEKEVDEDQIDNLLADFNT